MTMVTDIDDLRAWASGCGSRGLKLCTEAADEIERLRAAIQTIGDLADVDADERGWMSVHALAGKPI